MNDKNVGFVVGSVAITIPLNKPLPSKTSGVKAFSKTDEIASVVDNVLLSPDNPSGTPKSFKVPYKSRISSYVIVILAYPHLANQIAVLCRRL